MRHWSVGSIKKIILRTGTCNNRESEAVIYTSMGCVDQAYIKNYTVIFNESHLSALHINLTHEPSSLQSHHLVWWHRNYDIEFQNSSKFSLGPHGELIIQQVHPADAGCYMAILSTNAACVTLCFKVFVECKYAR